MNRIYVLTQFMSVSLHRHIRRTYNFDAFSGGFVEILAAQQTNEKELWYQGTADAVRQNLRYFLNEKPDVIVVLSGDQLYRMDLSVLIQQHVDSGAEATVSTKPVGRREAGSLGLMEVEKDGRIIRFVEKPGNTDLLSELRAPLYAEERYLANVGIYIVYVEMLGLDGKVEGFKKATVLATKL